MGRTPGGGEEERAERSSQSLRGPQPKVGLTVTDALRKGKSRSCVHGGHCPEPLTQPGRGPRGWTAPRGPDPRCTLGSVVHSDYTPDRRCGEAAPRRAATSSPVGLPVRPLLGRWAWEDVWSVPEEITATSAFPPALGSSASTVRTRESPPSIMGTSIYWGLTSRTHGGTKCSQSPIYRRRLGK